MSEKLMVVGDDGIPIPGGHVIGEGLPIQGHPHYPPGHYPPGHYPPGHYPPGHYPPGHYPPGHDPDSEVHFVDHNPECPCGDPNNNYPASDVHFVDHNPEYPHGGVMYDHGMESLQRSAAPPATEEEKEKE